MPLVPFVPGQQLQAAPVNTALDNVRTTKLLFADLTVNNNTTISNSTDLVAAVVANAWYTFDSLVRYDSGTTPDVKLQLTGPTGTAFTLARWGAGTGATGTVNSIDQGVTLGTTTWVQAFGGAGAGTSMTARVAGYFVVSTTAGNLQLGFAQNTANVSNTLLRQGTWFALTRVL